MEFAAGASKEEGRAMLEILGLAEGNVTARHGSLQTR